MCTGQAKGVISHDESTRGGAPNKEYFVDKLPISTNGRTALTEGTGQNTSSEESGRSGRSELPKGTILLEEIGEDGSEGPDDSTAVAKEP